MFVDKRAAYAGPGVLLWVVQTLCTWLHLFGLSMAWYTRNDPPSRISPDADRDVSNHGMDEDALDIELQRPTDEAQRYMPRSAHDIDAPPPADSSPAGPPPGCGATSSEPEQ